jgi:hypothetical protein
MSKRTVSYTNLISKLIQLWGSPHGAQLPVQGAEGPPRTVQINRAFGIGSVVFFDDIPVFFVDDPLVGRLDHLGVQFA